MSRATVCLLDSEYPAEQTSSQSVFARATKYIHRLSLITNQWHERSKQRRQLLELADDPALLKDLGLSNYDLQHEGRKPFWRR